MVGLVGGSAVLALLMFALPATEDAFGLPDAAAFYIVGTMIFVQATGLFIADADRRTWLTIARAPVLALLWLILVMMIATAAHFVLAAF